MEQEYLPGMGLTKEQARAVAKKEKIERSHRCRACPNCAERTVTWDLDMKVFSCYLCGRIDALHTKEVNAL